MKQENKLKDSKRRESKQTADISKIRTISKQEAQMMRLRHYRLILNQRRLF